MENKPFFFDPFVFDSLRGTLHRHGSPVVIGQRGAALLRVLLAADGGVVTKAALLDAAWPEGQRRKPS
jgi:DNA-binding winged helix-turn-helix (wHTH) protein